MPDNQNGGSSAGSGGPRLGGMLGPLHVCGRPSPDPLVPPDGLRPPSFWGGGGGGSLPAHPSRVVRHAGMVVIGP